MMKMRFLLATLGALFIAAPAWSQKGNGRLVTSAGEIRIPSQEQLEREVMTNPRNDFSSIDAVADGEMERMDREIDSAVVRGICRGC
jgi:hypothetical protein